MLDITNDRARLYAGFRKRGYGSMEDAVLVIVNHRNHRTIFDEAEAEVGHVVHHRVNLDDGDRRAREEGSVLHRL